MGATAKGLDDIVAKARARAARARDITPALRVVAEIVKTTIDDRFRSSTGFSGQAFAPNKPGTVKRKGSSKPLVDTGVLRGSISATPVGRDTVRFGTNTPYAAFPAFGTRRIPERNPFPVDALGHWLGAPLATQLLARVGRVITNYITTGRASG